MNLPLPQPTHDHLAQVCSSVSHRTPSVEHKDNIN